MTDWQNRIVAYKQVPANQLLANPSNARRHPPRQREALLGSLDALGIVDAVLVNVRTGYLIDGHARVEEALTRNEDMPLPVLEVDLSPDEEKLFLASFDYITYMADYDRDALDSLLQQLQADDSAMSTVIEGDERLQAMLSEMAAEHGLTFGDEPEVTEDAGAQLDRAEELQEQWQVSTGDLWIIPSITGDGQHRLLCGDSTNADDVSRVMAGEKVDAVVTDPPYGINHDTNYTRFTGGEKRSRNFGSPIYGDDTEFDPSPFLNYSECLLWGANAYSNCLPLGSWLVWDKRHDGQDKLMSDGEVAFLNSGHGIYIFNHTWNGFLRDSERGKTLHPTQKPVELFKWCLEFIKSQIVYDPYGGSGPIMAACEQLQRQCRMIEIAPKYCAVILQRMTDLGCTPERV